MNNPFTHSSLKKSSITSPEKEEKVVRAPRNPVTKNNRHSGLNCGKVQKAANKIPIKKQPIKLATSVPNASELNRELSHKPNPQRKDAPIAAPALTRKID